MKLEVMVRVAGLALATVLAGGCVTNPPVTGESVSQGVKREDSSFDKAVRFNGPEILDYVPRGMLNDHVRWRIRAWTDKVTGVTTRQLYVRVWYQGSGWRFYRTASFVGGDTAHTTRIDSEPQCSAGGGYVSCTYEEVVGVTIPDSKWTAARAQGLDVRLNGQKGADVVVKVPAAYMAGFDAAVSGSAIGSAAPANTAAAPATEARAVTPAPAVSDTGRCRWATPLQWKCD